MVLVAMASIGGLPVEQPTSLMPPVKAAVGTLLGARFSGDLLASIPSWSLSLLFLCVALLAMCAASFIMLRRLFALDSQTAALCSVPGGITEMIILSEKAGADQTRVAIIHALRIALTILILPFLISWIAHIDIQSAAPSSGDAMSFADWLWFLGCVASGALVTRLRRFPAPSLIVPLLLSATLHVSGAADFSVPSWVMIVVQVFIGINVGARFFGTTPRQLTAVVGAAVVVVAVQIGIAIVVATTAAALTDWDPLALMLAYAPGGLAEMSLIAVAMGREVAFVGIHHIFRVLLALVIGPALLGSLRTGKGD
jgi:membrane AbrB-like protein